MGLMDRVKQQAAMLAQATQEAAQGGMATLNQAQASRRGEMMLRQLGAAVFAERTGRGTGDSQAKIDKLISDLSAHEQANGLNLAADPSLPAFMQQAGVPNPGAGGAGGFAGQVPGGFAGQGTGGFADHATGGLGPGGFGAGPTGFADQGNAPATDASTPPAGSQQEAGFADGPPVFFPAPDQDE